MNTIDAMVAEKVFGWKWWSSCGKSHLCPTWAEESPGFLPHVHFRPGKEFDAAPIENYYSNYGHMKIHAYTTNAEAMMEVVEKMGNWPIPTFTKTKLWTLDHAAYRESWVWVVKFEKNWGLSWSAHHQSLPMAVCLAALRAVGVPESEIEAARVEP